MNMVRHLALFLSQPPVRNDETSAVAAIRNFYGAVTVLAVIPMARAEKTIDRKDVRREKERRARPHRIGHT